MCVCSRETLVRYDELPKINGVAIESIYAYKRDHRMRENRDAHHDEIPDFYMLKPHHRSDPKIYVKTLPEQFARIFGRQTYGDTTITVTNMWYRTDDSYNGSFVDQTMTLEGHKDNGRTEWFCIYRGIKDSHVKIDSDLGKAMLNTLKLNLKVEVMDECDYIFYPCTPIRLEGVLFYPDVQLESWRWMYGMPYISRNNEKDMRVYSEELNAHLYIQKVVPSEGDENLLRIDYSRDKKPEHFCHIDRWERHPEFGNDLIRYKILSINKDKTEVRAAMMAGEKLINVRYRYADSFYKICSIVRIGD